MKNSYKKLLIFQCIIFLVLILNSFVSNILSGYNFTIFLTVLLFVFKFIFGFERDRNRYTKDIIYDTFILLLAFFVFSYLLGLIIGFAKVNNYYNWYGLKTFIIPLVLITCFKEILRYMMIKKSEGNKYTFIVTIFLFIFLDITEAIYYSEFNSNYNIFIFIALSLIPAISSNIVFSYVTDKVGYKPLILYLLTTKLYVYLLPIVPDFSEYLTAIIGLLLPIALGYKVYKFLKREKDEITDRNYRKKGNVLMIIYIFIIITIVYFTSGYFKYYAVAIASGSMSPNINKGDIVVVEKINGNYDSLEVGNIIAYEHSGVVVVHRIVNILKVDNKYYFYTKGDANNNSDNYAVYEEMVIGVVNVKIPYIGLPTVWLNEM